MMPDPRYDPATALPAGLVLTRAYDDALHAAYLTGGRVPLTEAQAIAATAPPPAPLTGLPRLPEGWT
jgi:hypothetical protein